MKLTLILAIVSMVFLVMACQPVQPVGDAAQLQGTQWVLTDLGGEAVPAEITVMGMFGEDGSLAGSSGCNSYNTSYEVNGQSLTVSPQIMSTMMMCPDPVMQVEQAYQQALTNVASYEISGDTLVLSDSSGSALMTFSAQSQGLAGTMWNVISYNNGKQGVVSVMAGTELTAEFQDNGNVGGNSGCNGYFGPFKTDGDQISIGPLAMTAKMCVDNEIMEQEGLYLQALESAATYRIEGSKLELRTADGAMAVNLAVVK